MPGRRRQVGRAVAPEGRSTTERGSGGFDRDGDQPLHDGAGRRERRNGALTRYAAAPAQEGSRLTARVAAHVTVPVHPEAALVSVPRGVGVEHDARRAIRRRVRVRNRQQIAGEQAHDEKQNDPDAHCNQYPVVQARSASRRARVSRGTRHGGSAALGADVQARVPLARDGRGLERCPRLVGVPSPLGIAGFRN